MALSLSVGLSNFLNSGGSFKTFLQGGVLCIYDGTQPTSADMATDSNVLNTITLSSAAYTPETRAIGSIAFSGASGSVSSVTVAGIEILGAAVSFTTTLGQLVADILVQINNFQQDYIATVSIPGSPQIFLQANYGSGSKPNGFVVAYSATTITATTAAMAGGVDAVNGLTWGRSLYGTMPKVGVWSGVATGAGTPKWFRYARELVSIGGPSGSSGSGGDSELKMDGAIGLTSGELMIYPLTSIIGVTQIIDSLTLTEPTS